MRLGKIQWRAVLLLVGGSVLLRPGEVAAQTYEGPALPLIPVSPMAIDPVPPEYRVEPLPHLEPLHDLSAYVPNSRPLPEAEREGIAEELKKRKLAVDRGEILYKSSDGIHTAEEQFAIAIQNLEIAQRTISEHGRVEPGTMLQVIAQTRAITQVMQFEHLKSNPADALKQIGELRAEVASLKADASAKEKELEKREELRSSLLEKVNDLYKWVIGGVLAAASALIAVARSMIRGKPERHPVAESSKQPVKPAPPPQEPEAPALTKPKVARKKKQA